MTRWSRLMMKVMNGFYDMDSVSMSSKFKIAPLCRHFFVFGEISYSRFHKVTAKLMMYIKIYFQWYKNFLLKFC